MNRLMQGVAAVFMGFLGYRMWIYATKLVEYGDRTMMLKIPLAPVNYFISVMLCFSAALLLLKAQAGAAATDAKAAASLTILPLLLAKK